MKIEWYRELQAKPLDEWIEHPRVVAGEAADEIERLEAERDAAIEEIKLVKSSADYHKSQDCMAIQNEIIAQRDEAWARIAALERAIQQIKEIPSSIPRNNWDAIEAARVIARAALKENK